MKKVGITGGIGAGKTTVCSIFKTLSVPVYYADARAKHLMAHHTPLKGKIIQAFGEKAYLNGSLNRPYLAQKIFSSEENTDKINQLVHPEVALDFKQWAEKQQAAYVLKEAALLIESGSYKSMDALIYVSAPEEERIARVMKRNPKRPLAEIKAIIKRQANAAEGKKLSDFHIQNSGSTLVIPQVIAIHRQLIGR